MQSRHGLGQTLVILGQPPITGEPGEEMLYHPAPRQQRKAALCCHRRVQTCVKDVVARHASTNGNPIAMQLLHGPSDYDPIRERISVLRPVRSSALDRRLSDLVLCVLGKFREFTHFPAGLEQWLETWHVQGHLAD